MVRRLFFAVVCSFVALTASAQAGSGSLKGTVTDKNSGEPLPFVNVVVENAGAQVAGGTTDFDGKFYIKPIDPGKYDVLISFVGYNSQKQAGVVISGNKITFLDVKLEAGIQLEEFEVVEYTVPLIDKDGGASGGTVTREDIAKMPGRSAASIATTVAGVSDAGTGGGLSIRGSRTENTYYYIDGVKVPAGASSGLPKSAIEEVQVITGGVPANYGDVTGGVISITTRGPSRKFFGGVEVLTSGFQVGDDVTDVYGLDKFGYNLVEGSLSGPLFWKKDSVGNKTKPILGFFFSGNLTHQVDASPSYIGDTRVKEEVRNELLGEPLTILDLGGGNSSVIYNTDYLRASDLEHLDTRQNASRFGYLASGKIDVTTSPTINLSFGGSVDFNSREEYSYLNSMLNAENNYQVDNLSWRVFGKFTQRFNSSNEEGKGGIKNAFYSIQADYSVFQQRVEDDDHQDKFFNYGHLGKFETYQANTYSLNDGGNAFVHDGFRDTLVTFTPSTSNADVAAITTQYFGLFDQEPFNIGGLFGQPTPPGPYENFEVIQSNNGLLNGQLPNSVYSMWSNIGNVDRAGAAEYTKFDRNQFRITAIGSADIGQHAVSLGIEYEQRTDRSYALAPVGLWTRARQLANFHIQELDLTDSTVTYPIGTLPLITYQRLIGDDQQFFDRNLRIALGLDPDGNDFIDVDALDPSVFSLDMFSADELLNDGNNLASFYGYDHVGERLNSKPTFDDFFTQRDANGEFTRVQAPYEPIYIAGYVMDKFAFDDIIFNVGVRVDRYDANQNVLKDKFLWQEAYTAGANPLFNEHPSNIGSDYVVYVDNIESPTTVVGYRDEETWFNASGQEVSDPSVLRTSTGIAPYLVSGGESQDINGSTLSKAAFKDYDPEVNIMPRIAFSFPISDEALFFAHYDVLTQRPTSNGRLDLVGYAYIQNTGNILNNPALKPTRTIDYELGFQQVLSKSSSIKFSAFYRELRDMIQVRQVVEAWPATYRSYDNLDFGTVKGLTVAYDLRKTGNVWMRASYTMQFADGTGSGTQTGLSLINSGQPNLQTIAPLNFDQRHRIQVTFDYRYGGGKDYNGPQLFGANILSRTGLNLVGIAGSGTPYSASSRIINEAIGAGGHRLQGSLNGSRLPWQFSLDAQLDKDIQVKFGKKDGDKVKTANLNIYLLVTNVLNTERVTGVWRATGNPDDDGYLAAPQWQASIEQQTDPQSYRDLYAQKVDNPFNYGAPRTIRLGARFDF